MNSVKPSSSFRSVATNLNSSLRGDQVEYQIIEEECLRLPQDRTLPACLTWPSRNYILDNQKLRHFRARTEWMAPQQTYCIVRLDQ